MPADGLIRVTGGADGEMIRGLDVAPHPDRPIRSLFAAEVIATDLQRLAGQQQEDGGWIVDFRSASPAGSLDWRGYATVRAIDIPRAPQRGSESAIALMTALAVADTTLLSDHPADRRPS